jgi:hypothetical protein
MLLTICRARRYKERGNVPNNSTKRSATSQSTTFVLEIVVRGGAGSEVAVVRQPEGCGRSRPGPGAEPEDDAEDIGDQSDDAVEDMRSPDFDCGGTAYDDECLNRLTPRVSKQYRVVRRDRR